jgi:hypothetical protein
LRALLAQRSIGKGLQRLVQRAQLVGEGEIALGVVEPLVQQSQLVSQSVEPLEHRIQLPVV